MPKRVKKLTAREVAAIKNPGLHAVGDGLYLQVTPSGAKSWVYRYQVAGKRRDMGLGSVSDLSLADAHDKRNEARKLVRDGTDPIDKRRGERVSKTLDAAKAMNFKDCAEGYIAAHRAGWRNPKHAAQWSATLSTYVYPKFGSLPVQAVDVGLVMQGLEQNVPGHGKTPTPLWIAKPETASRVRGRIEAVLDWATARGYRQGENPARWKGHLENLLTPPSKAKAAARRQTGRQEHHAALPYDELTEFMVELRQQDGVAARALEFAILTAARTGEVLGATWAEIDLEARLWTIPGERMKAGKEHRVPLSEPALSILRALAEIRTGEHIFPGNRVGRPLSNMAMLMLLRRMGRGDLTAHGFRSAFSDWCAEQTNTPSEVREMALAHTVGDKVEAAYRRGDLFEKRREVMAAWGRYAEGGASVVNLEEVRRAG